MLGQRLLDGNADIAEAWNFGPDREGNRQVKQVLVALQANWSSVKWNCSDAPQLHEAQLLHLDSGKAREKLSWRPVWSFDEGVAATAEWYQAWLDRRDVVSQEQLNRYIKQAKERGISWAVNVQA